MTTAIEIIRLQPQPYAQIDISPEALLRRDELIAKSGSLPPISSNEAAQVHADLLREIKTFTKDIELSRATVKAPVLQISKEIDERAREVTQALEALARQLSVGIGEWQLTEQRRLAEERRKAQEEVERIKQEAAAKMQFATTERQKERIEDRAVAKIAEAKADYFERGAARVLGTATRTEIRFEVTDLRALYNARPELCKVEVVASLLKAALKNLPDGEGLPGVRHWKEGVTHVR